MFIALRFRLLDPPLDLTHVFEILCQLRPVTRTKVALQVFHTRAQRISYAVFCLKKKKPVLRGGPVTAEHALENHARVDLHRLGLRGRSPGNRAHVRAEEVTGAASEMAGVVLGGELHGGESRSLTMLLRDDLVDRCSQTDIGPMSRHRTRQKHRTAR